MRRLTQLLLAAGACLALGACPPNTTKLSGGSAAGSTSSKASTAAGSSAGAKGGRTPSKSTAAATAANAAARGSLAKMPALFGVRFGATVAQASAALKSVAKEIRPPANRVMRRWGTAVQAQMLGVVLEPSKAPGVRRMKLYFFNGGLARYKLYGDQARATVAKVAGKPDADSGRYHYWFNQKKLIGMRCRRRKCELFDMNVLAARKAATVAQLRGEFGKLLRKMDWLVRRHKARQARQAAKVAGGAAAKKN